ncbi:MAG: hypothetical protein SGILL_004404 [Bacillariaceae sp.]
MSDHDGKGYNRLSTDPCGSLWFHRFMEGMKKRMGEDWRPNQALTAPLLKRLLDDMSVDIAAADEAEAFDLTMIGVYLLFSYVLSFRGPEGLLLDIRSSEYERYKQEDSIVVGLWGKVKGENAARQHLLPCSNETKSGLKVRQWWHRALDLCKTIQRSRGPVMRSFDGSRMTSTSINKVFQRYLTRAFENDRDLFPSSITSIEKVSEAYHTFRSGRRGSDTRAIDENVSKTDIYVINRWKKAPEQRGAGTMPMEQRYADLKLLKKPFLRYTYAM